MQHGNKYRPTGNLESGYTEHRVRRERKRIVCLAATAKRITGHVDGNSLQRSPAIDA